MMGFISSGFERIVVLRGRIHNNSSSSRMLGIVALFHIDGFEDCIHLTQEDSFKSVAWKEGRNWEEILVLW
jgi:hypothetical protein